MPHKLRSYPKIYPIDHPVLKKLFDGPVVCQEKIDGSQFSFGVIEGQLCMRSRGSEVFPETADKLFRGAANAVKYLYENGGLTEGWVYRAEVISKPKHNTLQYQRVPNGFLVLFDIDTGLETRLSPVEVGMVAAGLDLEVVPTFSIAGDWTLDKLKAVLEDTAPLLGGPMIEGLVIKNFNQFNPRDGKMLMGKVVNEVFREKHARQWKKDNPTKRDVIETLIESLRTEARWEKAVQHMRERGDLQNAPQDIGPLLKELQQDVLAEEAEWVAAKLTEAFMQDILRGVTRGFPEWYKIRIVESQFKEDEDEGTV